MRGEKFRMSTSSTLLYRVGGEFLIPSDVTNGMEGSSSHLPQRSQRPATLYSTYGAIPESLAMKKYVAKSAPIRERKL